MDYLEYQWLVYLNGKLDRVLAQGVKIMSALTNLQTQMTALETEVTKVVTTLDTLKTDLDAAIAAGNLADIQTVADRIGAVSTALDAAVTKDAPPAPPPP